MLGLSLLTHFADVQMLTGFSFNYSSTLTYQWDIFQQLNGRECKPEVCYKATWNSLLKNQNKNRLYRVGVLLFQSEKVYCRYVCIY